MLRPARALALVVLVGACGCASLIGASFDDATQGDAASPDADTADGGGLASLASVPGLVAWFSADRNVYTTQTNSGPVTQWVDQTSAKHVAVAPTDAQRPTLLPLATGGKPAVHFDSSNAQVLQVNWSGPGSNALTLFVVARGYPQSVVRFQKSYSAPPFIIFPYDVAVASDAGPAFGLFIDQEVNPHMPVDPARFELLEARYGKGKAQTFVDGQLAEQLGTRLAALPDGLTLFLGGVMPSPAQPYTWLPYANADVAEVAVYAAYLDDTQRVAVEQYLRARWGL